MQQIHTERQQTSVRLPGQLPANLIEAATTSPIHHKHENKKSKSVSNRDEQIKGGNQSKSPLRHLQTDRGDFDTYRSLSTCPTYSSLSRHSVETRECGTQITTLPSTETIEDDQDISSDSPLPIDDNPVLLADEVALMPISSGFIDYPYDYSPRIRERAPLPQIISRAPQFRTNQRNPNQNGSNTNPKSKSKGKLPPVRPTAARKSARSDTSALPAKQQEVDPKISKPKPAANGFRRVPPKENLARSPSPPPQKKRIESVHRTGPTRPSPKHRNSPDDEEDFGRKPVRFANKRNPAYHPSPSPPPVHRRKSTPLSRDVSNRARRVHVGDNEYIIERRRQPPPPPPPTKYVYEDYRTDSPIERRRRPQRRVRVLQEAPYREDVDYDDDDDDGVYYVEPASSRRAPVVRKPPPRKEYVYAEETPARNRHRRSEVVYVDEDDDRPIEYQDEYVYIDEDGNEVEYHNQRTQSPEYVQYIHENEKDKRRSHKAKVIYVDDDAPIPSGRNRKKSKQPSSTRIVYD